MKHFWKIALVGWLMAASVLAASAQGKVETKKFKLQDLQQKITKVVMTGNDFRDGALRQDIVARWRINPFEFCSLAEFEKLKSDANYYFLIVTTGQFSGEIESKAVFWAAADKCMKAKQVDPSCADKANGLIRAYTAAFPSMETIFFNDYSEGQSFQVGGWIGESTTIRARK